MEITGILAPVVFMKAGEMVERGDSNGYILMVIGLAMMFHAMVNCRGEKNDDV
jgi:hypothetical protein